MIDQKTLESAKNWCELGVNWIDRNAVPTGVQYLDRAITVFDEVQEIGWLTYARHQKLSGLKSAQRDDEAEALGEDVLKGYLRLNDAYGKALVLSHIADSMARLGRWERAMSRLNLATAIARAAGYDELKAYILTQRANLFLQHENLVQAIRLYKQAEAMLQKAGRNDDAARNRHAAAQGILRLGERTEAIALLEDVQSHFFGKGNFREALHSLSLLNRLYEQADMWEDKNRVAELVHFCGQYILQGAPEQKVSPEPQILSHLVSRGVGSAPA